MLDLYQEIIGETRMVHRCHHASEEERELVQLRQMPEGRALFTLTA